MDAASRYYETETRLSASVSERMLDLAGVREGTRVLDLASGRGEPALRAAARVGPAGRVLGVDPFGEALAAARVKARAAGLANVEFRTAEAESIELAGGFDAATCRWGLMYMASPERALAAVKKALVPGGLFVAALWCEPERVPWWSLPRRVTSRFAVLPPIDPSRPGVFRYANVQAVERDFTASGFALEHTEEIDVAVAEADDGVGIAAWVAVVLGRMLEPVPDTSLSVWEADLAREAEAYRRGATIRLGGVTRLVVARSR